MGSEGSTSAALVTAVLADRLEAVNLGGVENPARTTEEVPVSARRVSGDVPLLNGRWKQFGALRTADAMLLTRYLFPGVRRAAIGSARFFVDDASVSGPRKPGFLEGRFIDQSIVVFRLRLRAAEVDLAVRQQDVPTLRLVDE